MSFSAERKRVAYESSQIKPFASTFLPASFFASPSTSTPYGSPCIEAWDQYYHTKEGVKTRETTHLFVHNFTSLVYLHPLQEAQILRFFFWCRFLFRLLVTLATSQTVSVLVQNISVRINLFPFKSLDIQAIFWLNLTNNTALKDNLSLIIEYGFREVVKWRRDLCSAALLLREEFYFGLACS